MALSTHGSFAPTLSSFRSHWENVNEEGPAELWIADPWDPDAPPLAVAVITELTAELQERALEVEDRVAQGDVATAELAEAKRAALDAAQELGRKVRAERRLRHLVAGFPQLPGLAVGEGAFLSAMASVRQRWKTAEAMLGTPFPLDSGEVHAGFVARVAALAGKYEALEDAAVAGSVARQLRDESEARAREILASYRAAVVARFRPEHPLVETLPRTYAAGGHPPEPVAASGRWDRAAGEAGLEWEASADAALSHYEIRASHHKLSYRTAVERVLGRVAADGELEFRTADGVGRPGDLARYRIYAVLAGGKERGSRTVTVKRPR